jgi:DNA-binding PucR family transcriptional regulator
VRRLVQQGVLADGGLVAAADHLPALVVHADATLLDDLARQVLAPLQSVPPARRAVLEDTLEAWLAHHGERAQVAAALTVHPQTVSYRMARLAELFGAALQDPGARWALALALAGRPTRS